MRSITIDEFKQIDVEYSRAVICGAGHVAKAVAAILPNLGFKVTIIDNREEVAESARSLDAEVICRDFSEALDAIESDQNTYFIVATYGHSYDYECLSSIFRKRYAYVGLLSSHSKSAVMRERLLNDGYDHKKVNALHSPIGLSIKAHTPEEIAISIAGQIILCRNSAALISYGKPVLTEDMKSFVEENEGPFVMATIIKKEGSAPRDVGTTMIFKNGGSFCGTIGGGSVEEGCKQVAAEIMKSIMFGKAIPNDEPLIREYDTATIRSDAPISNLKCGGIVTVEFFLI